MDNRNVALITGITGQDGSYLAELLLEKGYDVHGTIRRSSTDFRERIAHLEGQPNFHLHYADLGDSMSIIQVMNKVKPTEVYNLAAQSHVQVSFDSPEFTADVDATGVLRILEAIRQCGLEKTCRMYQASTSELYGKVEEVPQNENTPFHPYSPYAVAKQYGFWIVKEYREAYNMFCCSGILFNHESERRGETFVTRKITLAAARIKQGKQEKLYLGNLDSLRDWGYAKDYVECMWLILQAEKPEDFVIATGKQHSVREFAPLISLISLTVTASFSLPRIFAAASTASAVRYFSTPSPFSWVSSLLESSVVLTSTCRPSLPTSSASAISLLFMKNRLEAIEFSPTNASQS